MTLTRTIATRPGEPPIRQDLDPAEEAARRAAWVAGDEQNLRRRLKDELKAEGLARIAAAEPAWDSFETIALIASLWPRLGAPPPNQALARDIYLYARSIAIAKIDTLTAAELGQVVATDAQPFAAVDPADAGWP